ncbi:MAG: RNA repair transcriptional activator RtcR family protein [Dethiobacter sp.]
MKILLSFVGKQDPISGNTNEEGAIVTLCRELKPDALYLYPTASSDTAQSETQTQANETCYWIATEVSPSIRVCIEPLVLPDPTDFAAILPRLHESLKKHPELKAADEIHMNCSSGTPQMQSTWLLIANSGLLPGRRLWQVKNPEYAIERVKELQIEFLEEENILNRLPPFSQKFLFAQMAEEMGRLGNMSLFPVRRKKARLLQRLFWVYQDWDMINYRKAYVGDDARPGLKELSAGFKPTRGDMEDESLKKVLEKQVALLEKLQRKNQKETPENLSDLYFNAHRSFSRGNYTDTLARFWRVYEGILYYQLRKDYGIEPTNPKKSSNKDHFQQLSVAVPGIMPQGSLGIRRSEKVLHEVFQDKKFQELANRSLQIEKDARVTVGSLLKELRENRNDSIVAHGMKPVEKQSAANALNVMRELFTGFFPTHILAEYPFQNRDLKIVVEYLTKNFSA